MANIPIFQYDSNDFHYIIDDSNRDASNFDSLLKEKWEQAEKNGILRYKLNIKEWKILEGQYRFLAQLNTDRALNRRQPEDISSMNQSFDPGRFNFTKISEKEIYFYVGSEDGNDAIVVNISPIEWGHCLFIPERFKCLPQRITKYSLNKIIELMLLSNSPYLRAVFNSLCAHASVNHLHWHLYYLKHQMLLEYIGLQQLAGPIFCLTDFPSKGFCLKLSFFPGNNIYKLVEWAYKIVDYLQESEIAHNVYITRAKMESKDKEYNDLRVYIWGRNSSIGIKDTRSFVPAVCELFGHLSIRSEQSYQNITEDEVAATVNQVCSSKFNAVKEKIRKLAVNNTMSEEPSDILLIHKK
ncbi:GDP-D-glucose phosphorylase 1 [Cephus cinctus]|uniref:GDP-D-glucose phosphorylase 1 n=1 Tax=Cephus cinctus TaxID=211228 RepID=A0AAJ7VYD4_CEPCN|nr:GDP-D-glucose phosphorylase 1 [Cephus cinctus]XP_024937788.1 GDP-D-glucose phosphorylase 1 [Cephus cinctus]